MKKYQKDIYRKRAKDLNEGTAKKISIPASLQISYMELFVEKLMVSKYLLKAIVRDLIESAYNNTSEYLI